ncbi:MAG: ribonuclease HII [Chitinophagaceae bacterium]|jgi:ribonuclease HII|nr:ribonuclease HII [Chitinophagaceae bacterium]MCA6467507.1 ribonuclease HII [Chitinophagaceae bacterium]MCA6470108.1 ribonuclease HII [Chitinophagaceae bacterium]MCA6478780.1 ribonuclease HII [Chitinophagaceae bacterium]MCA6480458.1 ribonuclease HII [Chitinophagaceae bacterium]
MLSVQHQTTLLEAGVDEAGRGCFAGPVMAAAVILPADFFHPLLNDSKQVKEADRYLLREIICKDAIAWGIGRVDAAEIDRMNILQATYRAMHSAIQQLTIRPELLLIDGNRFSPYPSIPHICVVKGDSKLANIAAASILAKTFRDDTMKQMALMHPQYGFEQNKGYGTAAHRQAIETHGLCDVHRKSFNIQSQQMPLWD